MINASDMDSMADKNSLEMIRNSAQRAKELSQEGHHAVKGALEMDTKPCYMQMCPGRSEELNSK